jgi:uncharacterized protein DUF4258
MSSLQDRLSKADAIKALRHCIQHGIIQYLPHVFLRCRQREIDLQDVVRVLKRGMIFHEPELELRRNEWRYKVEGSTSEGIALAVVVAFADENTTVVITVMLP